MSRLQRVPPSPDVMRSLYDDYLQEGQGAGLTFAQYLQVIGFTNPAVDTHGMDDGTLVRVAATSDGPELISVPSQAVQGSLRVMVLLVDFEDVVGTTDAAHYEDLLFSKGAHPTGSLRDFYAEVSLDKVDVIGEVHGWLRLPQRYTYYTNGRSGTGLTYPRNAQRMAEDAVRAALDDGVEFSADLDALGHNAVTALFIVHAGIGAESQPRGPQRDNNIWSHKWGMPNPVRVGDDLWVNRYLTVPHDARLGVAAHELGHLAFQWDDYYDPNYAQDGSAWDGAGDWDLMAGGSYNGDSRSPAHPIGWHKSQHGWIELEEVTSSRRLELEPFTTTSGKVYKVNSPRYRADQYLILENRTRFGFDSHLPGEGLLVWRIDESKEMFAPQRPALQLVQADGRHDLERIGDLNAGDSGDPFPGSTGRTRLSDSGNISTSFPGGDDSQVELKNIERDAATGRITLDVEISGAPVTGGRDVVRGESSPSLTIPDDDDAGVEDGIVLSGDGTVREITVAVDVTHTYIGDLRVELVSPSGRRAVLHDRSGGPTRDLLKVYSSTDMASLRNLDDDAVAGTWTLRISDRARRDVGTLNRWSLAVDAATETRAVLLTSTPALAIPDADPGGVSDVLHVAHGGIVRSLRLGVDITHPYIGDLRVEVVGPTGARAVLHNRSGGNTADLKRSWESTSTPALAALVGSAVRGDWVLRVSDHAGRDTGILDAWTLDVDLSPRAQTVEAAATPALAIPDKDTAGVSSVLAFPQQGTVQAIEVAVSITHSYVGDLRIELFAPSGERAVLRDQSGGNLQDLDLELDSASSPLLAALVGQPIEGNWVLRVMDLEALDRGTLESWALNLTYSG